MIRSILSFDFESKLFKLLSNNFKLKSLIENEIKIIL